MSRRNTFNSVDDEIIRQHIDGDGVMNYRTLMAALEAAGRARSKYTVRAHVEGLRALGRLPRPKK